MFPGPWRAPGSSIVPCGEKETTARYARAHMASGWTPEKTVTRAAKAAGERVRRSRSRQVQGFTFGIPPVLTEGRLPQIFIDNDLWNPLNVVALRKRFLNVDPNTTLAQDAQ